MLNCTNPDRTLADYLGVCGPNSQKKNIHSVEQPQDRKRRALHGGTTKPSVEHIRSTLQNAKLGPCNISAAPQSSNMSPLDDVRGDFLYLRGIANAPFENKVLLDWIRNAIKLTKIVRFAYC